jgi:hypothetical protein
MTKQVFHKQRPAWHHSWGFTPPPQANTIHVGERVVRMFIPCFCGCGRCAGHRQWADLNARTEAIIHHCHDEAIRRMKDGIFTHGMPG